MLDFTLGLRPSAVFFGGHLKGLSRQGSLSVSSMSFSMSLGETKLIFESKLTRLRFLSPFFLNCCFFLFRLALRLDLTRGLFRTTVLGLLGLGLGLVGGLVGLVVGLGLRGLGLCVLGTGGLVDEMKG